MPTINQGDLITWFDKWKKQVTDVDDLTVADFKHWLGQPPQSLKLAGTSAEALALKTWVAQAVLDAEDPDPGMFWTQTPHAVYSSKDPNKVALISGDEHRLLGTLGTSSHVAVDPKDFHTNHGIVEIGLVVSAEKHYRSIKKFQNAPRHAPQTADRRGTIRRKYIFGYLSFDNGTFTVVKPSSNKVDPAKVDIAVFVSGTLSESKPMIPKTATFTTRKSISQRIQSAPFKPNLSTDDREEQEEKQQVFDRATKDRQALMAKSKTLPKGSVEHKETVKQSKHLDLKAKRAREEYFDTDTQATKKNKLQPVGKDEVLPDAADEADFLDYVQDNKIYTKGKNAKSINWAPIAHSEEWVVHVLRNNLDLFTELMTLYGVPNGAKVYGVVIDIFSTRDVCANCQKAIKLLMDKGKGFLDGLKDHLIAQGYVVTAQQHGLRMLPRVSSQIEFMAPRTKEADRFTRIMDVKSAAEKQIFTATVWDEKMKMQNAFLMDQT